MSFINKADIKSGLKMAFWAAVGTVIFVAPVSYVISAVKARLGVQA